MFYESEKGKIQKQMLKDLKSGKTQSEESNKKRF